MLATQIQVTVSCSLVLFVNEMKTV